jgi:glycine/D-amino acid oxidase-like deaminating enzyme/nitrite reductase/ring-hydroxylating ferredoxin subunit
MTSLWLDRDRTTAPVPFPAGDRFDVAVVGAGLTGLTVALLLARAGSSVVVVEGRRVGSGTTGNTTAKVSLLQGTRLSAIVRRHSAATAEQYVEANREGQAWLLRYCADHNIPFQVRPAYSYAATRAGGSSVRDEFAAGLAAGLPVEWVDDTELPFPVFGAVRLADQAQFNPMDVLTVMVKDVMSRGGLIVERSRVRQIHPGTVNRITTDRGTLQADRVVLATGTPIMDRGGFFARLEPLRSYASAFRVPGSVPEGMYLSVDASTRSVRSAPTPDGQLLLTGGNGHVVGRRTPTSELIDDLTGWTKQHWPGAERTHVWSAQDYHSMHELPYAGPLSPVSDRVLVATGYDKWGMTNAVAAALSLSSQMLGGQTEWASVMRSWSAAELSGALPAAKLNAGVAFEFSGGWIRPLLSPHDQYSPAEGSGMVVRAGASPVAVCTVDGRTIRRSAVCTHLHGVVSWNDAERSWDCPLHGSRFTADGTVLEGPATADLKPADPATD